MKARACNKPFWGNASFQHLINFPTPCQESDEVLVLVAKELAVTSHATSFATTTPSLSRRVVTQLIHLPKYPNRLIACTSDLPYTSFKHDEIRNVHFGVISSFKPGVH